MGVPIKQKTMKGYVVIIRLDFSWFLFSCHDFISHLFLTPFLLFLLEHRWHNRRKRKLPFPAGTQKKTLDKYDILLTLLLIHLKLQFLFCWLKVLINIVGRNFTNRFWCPFRVLIFINKQCTNSFKEILVVLQINHKLKKVYLP